MIRHCAVIALMTATLMAGPFAWGARESHTFDVSVTIPSRAFYITPTEPGWIHLPQEMRWNHFAGNFNTLAKYFDVRHDTSAIEARLETTPYLSNGWPTQNIQLRVTFNGVPISTDVIPREVVSATEAAAGKRVLLQIETLKPANGFKAGEYTGNVVLLFNAKAPGA
nr:CS1 type fimbrial major subunit [Pseudomonas sp. Irchel s3b5]